MRVVHQLADDKRYEVRYRGVLRVRVVHVLEDVLRELVLLESDLAEKGGVRVVLDRLARVEQFDDDRVLVAYQEEADDHGEQQNAANHGKEVRFVKTAAIEVNNRRNAFDRRRHVRRHDNIKTELPRPRVVPRGVAHVGVVEAEDDAGGVARGDVSRRECDEKEKRVEEEAPEGVHALDNRGGEVVGVVEEARVVQGNGPSEEKKINYNENRKNYNVGK